MSKFSITQLETARKNPTQFANNLKAAAGVKPSFFGRVKFTRWQDSIGEFHKQSDLLKAINYLERSFSNRADNLKNRKEVIKFISSLDAYAAEFKKKGFTILERRTNIHIDLNAKVFISGQIPITYMNTKGGFSVYFFSQTGIGWEGELRFPIVQKYFAETIYGVDLNKIEVGIFSTANDKFSQETFSDAEVMSAENELREIGKIMFDIL